MAAYFKRMLRSWDMYLLLVPALAFLAVFKYMPMWGLRIAFQDYNIFAKDASPYVGLANFQKLASSKDFYGILSNTLIISFLKIGLLFPLGIIIALILNEVRRLFFKKAIQTIIYIPHFFSWIVVAGMFMTILSTSNGLVNNLISALGGTPIKFLTSAKWFRSVLVFSAGWKELGWNAIVFIAAIAGIDQEMYEAANLDGAGRLRTIWSVTLPAILPTIILMFILRTGSILEAGTEQILAMYNPVVYSVADVIGTYVYRVGLGKMDYSFSTAVGLFNSLAGLILVMSGNALSKRFTGSSIW
ncbi:MAG: ABC transporter permease subunit [Clostridiales bacterium]|jgi:putative aldouronate transport system permease protein|nr:ABC transporter permease subunit [Clostridiales bacterium]